jgi:acetyl coenzyme A synthetase (ADP forming)-like protein
MGEASKGLHKLFNPESVAIIGASAREDTIGYDLVHNLKLSNFRGDILPVNPKYETILGAKCYKGVGELPHPPDLTIIAVPAAVVNEVVEDACRHGAKMFIVISSGFREVGRLDLENGLIGILKKYGARTLGPNVFGVYSASSEMNATFGPPNVKPGNVGIISQSGALGVALMGKSVTMNIGLSAVISIGNEADISEREALAYLGNDECTEVIFIYMEGCRNGREFMELASEISKRKPIIIIKSGRSERGALAAASHTGSLTGSDKVFDAAIRQAGALRASSLDDAFSWIRILADMPLPKREGTVILTNGGGVGVIATDSAEKYGVGLLDDPIMLEKVFRPSMPEYGSTKNPVDITGQGRNELYGISLEAALREESIPSLVGLYCTQATMDVTAFAATVANAVEKWKGRKPLTFSIIGGIGVSEAIKLLNDLCIPCFDTPDQAMSAMGAIYDRWRWLNTDFGVPEDIDMDLEAIQGIITKAQENGFTQLVESDCAEILRIAGLVFPETRIARNLREALAAADEIGYPVVLKVLSPDIVHKTEFGCVKLDLEDEGELSVAYESIMAEVKHRVPGARIYGVSVTEMVTDAIETILGFSVDQSFGPVLMFGMGGIYVEVLKDVSFRVAPISRLESMRMVKDIASYPILAGARGKELRDIKAIVDAVSRLSFLATHTKDILELDINPLMVLGKGRGCKVVDSRITVKSYSRLRKGR